MVEPNALRILVVNGKGGCGKTTIATNLAAAMARQGHGVALIDHDSQASSSHWLEMRAQECAPVHLVEAHQRTSMYATRSFQQRLPNGTDRIIVDTPSAVSDKDLDVLLRGCHIILIPVLPSGFDMRAAERFVEQLKHHRLYKGRPVPVATIANRVRPNTQGHARLSEFLTQLEGQLGGQQGGQLGGQQGDQPGMHHAATFRDRAVYARLAEQGRGIFDVPDEREAAAEVAQWESLIEWINEVGTTRANHPPSRAPAARAIRHSSDRNHQSI